MMYMAAVVHIHDKQRVCEHTLATNLQGENLCGMEVLKFHVNYACASMDVVVSLSVWHTMLYSSNI